MNVEAACVHVAGDNKVPLVKIIKPGDWKGIDFLEGVKIAAFCSLTRKCGTAIIIDPEDKTKAYLYRNNRNRKKRKVNTELPVRIKGKQELVVQLKEKEDSNYVGISLNEKGEDDGGTEFKLSPPDLDFPIYY
jgi:hypothetical protein